MKNEQPCCRNFGAAISPCTDSEGFGSAIKKWNDLCIIGTDLPEIRFCPWCGKELGSQLVYDPDLKMPPEAVCEAAKTIENYFNENHPGNWEFMGLRNRFQRSQQ